MRRDMNRGRISRVASNMKTAGLEQIIVTSTASIFYLTGLWVEPHERMIALYMDEDGKTTLFGNEIFGIEETPELLLITHKDGENPVKGLASAVMSGKIGIDKAWYSRFLLGLMELRNDIVPVNVQGRRYRKAEKRTPPKSSLCAKAPE
jgi:Xaa-Pro dipeptidase